MSPAHGSFTEQVRQELSRVPIDDAQAPVELGVLLRLAGALHRAGTDRGSETRIEVASRSGAVVRRVFTLVDRLTGARPELWVRAPSGVQQATTYGATLRDGAEPLGRRLDLIDTDGRPVRGLPRGARDAPVATLRAALLAAGSISNPGRPVHLEVGVPGQAVGEELAELFRAATGAGALARGRRPRVVVKSGEAVEVLLVRVGATQAFLRWEEGRLRHEVRNAATRLANADAANVRRTIDAASAQVADVERVIERVGWDGLDEDLRGVALARLANPMASLAELGELCDPPLSKSSVHRRLQRLRTLAAGGPRGGAESRRRGPNDP